MGPACARSTRNAFTPRSSRSILVAWTPFISSVDDGASKTIQCSLEPRHLIFPREDDGGSFVNPAIKRRFGIYIAKLWVIGCKDKVQQPSVRIKRIAFNVLERLQACKSDEGFIVGNRSKT